jgi:organic hydroperoxide reductase OsmC/OhrA
MAEATTPRQEIHKFTVSGTWSGDGTGCGQLRLPEGNLQIPIGGSKKLGGCGVGANPEEILLGAVAACFLNTWAIFLRKLNVAYQEPAVRVSGDLGPDPAGGFKMLDATIHALVPRALLADQRGPVEKTLQLAEKYCITSKVARSAMPVRVELEEV